MSQDTIDGLFTLGVPPDRYHLPHPRLGLPVILLVRRVVLRAFEILCARGFLLTTEKEDAITAALRGIIENDLRRTGSLKGFSCRTYNGWVEKGRRPIFSFITHGTTAVSPKMERRQD